MIRSFIQHLLPVLQFTRMALVFTAIADGVCSILLWSRLHGQTPSIMRFVSAALISIGLYGFGMSLNDLIDRRRDIQMAPGRPLPSGRLQLRSAYAICIGFILLAMLGAGWNSTFRYVDAGGWMTIVLTTWTMTLIVFYDFAGKYLVAPGLLTLGLIRFFHAAIPAPMVPLLWHPLLLLNHVTILSTVCYALEEKRPTLTRGHWLAVLGGLGFVDAMAIGVIAWRRAPRTGDLIQSLWLERGLVYPLGAICGFVALACWIRLKTENGRAAGQKLMLAGLLWLIVYDAAFVGGYVSLKAGGLVLLLLPMAYGSVLVMRTWANVVALSQTPAYRRAGQRPVG